MERQVELFGMNVEVTFDDEKIFELTTSNGDIYDEAVVTKDGRLIVFDEGLGVYVQYTDEASEVLDRI